MSTISQWLDAYDGPDNLVAGVAQIWRRAKDEDDARPRVSAPQSVSTWLAEHRGVSDEALRAAVRAYNESRGGRQLTLGEEGAFRAMNEPGTIAPVPGDHEQPAGLSPAMMGALGRIEQALDQRLGAIYQQNEVILRGLEALATWTHDQDERIKPITDLLGELAEAENTPDDVQEAPGSPQSGEQGPDGDGVYVPPEQPAGSLWRNIAAPEPDPERMAALGDPRLVEDEPG